MILSKGSRGVLLTVVLSESPGGVVDPPVEIEDLRSMALLPAFLHFLQTKVSPSKVTFLSLLLPLLILLLLPKILLLTLLSSSDVSLFLF